MNEVRSTHHQPSSRYGTDGRVETRKTGAAGLNDMTYLILSAIAAALLVGLLVLPVNMPGTAHHSARADMHTRDAPTALVKGPASFEA